MFRRTKPIHIPIPTYGVGTIGDGWRRVQGRAPYQLQTLKPLGYRARMPSPVVPDTLAEGRNSLSGIMTYLTHLGSLEELSERCFTGARIGRVISAAGGGTGSLTLILRQVADHIPFPVSRLSISEDATTKPGEDGERAYINANIQLTLLLRLLNAIPALQVEVATMDSLLANRLHGYLEVDLDQLDVDTIIGACDAFRRLSMEDLFTKPEFKVRTFSIKRFRSTQVQFMVGAICRYIREARYETFFNPRVFRGEPEVIGRPYILLSGPQAIVQGVEQALAGTSRLTVDFENRDGDQELSSRRLPQGIITLPLQSRSVHVVGIHPIDSHWFKAALARREEQVRRLFDSLDGRQTGPTEEGPHPTPDVPSGRLDVWRRMVQFVDYFPLGRLRAMILGEA